MDPLSPLIDAIGRTITPTAEVANTGSPALAAIRRSMQVMHDRLLTRITELLNSPAGRLAAQEPIITQRAGRYVIPVKADMRGQMRGIVHDVSQSGATLFIEPLAVVDLGNEWRELQIEEEREVERILRELSALVGSAAGQVVANVDTLAEFDVLYAKVRLASALRATDLPEESGDQRWLVESGELNLVNARHPLLGDNVVPTSIRVGGDFQVLLITGPNTGGKTVALKTAGLLVLMAAAGIPIPADTGSRVPIYREVFADIGDEQSIEQSLSTFSSHMRNVIDVLAHAGPDSLVLLDELGAGTDPEEGSALAQSIVETLLARGSKVIATTHHSQLKLFAQQAEGVENASVEFDAETLAPTYRLSIGVPGRSNAIAIARGLGMPEAVLHRASQLVSHEQVQVDGLLDDIRRRQAETERMETAEAAALREAEELRETARARLAEIEAETAEILHEAAFEVERDIAAAREELRRAARAVRTATPAEAASHDLARHHVEAAQEVHRRLRRRAAPERRRRQPGLSAEQVVAGDRVWIRGVGAPGEALGPPDERGEIDVLLGSLRTRVRSGQVERVQRPERAPSGAIALPQAPDTEPELEVRAQRVEEVLPKLERFLDDAFRTGLSQVRIIHGKGTGTLRRVVRERLAEHPLVKSYETASREEGGEGVTVATLAS
jgi:DNA mismatch repair protein MutS2